MFVLQPRQVGEDQAVHGQLATLHPGDRDLGARQAAQELVGPGEIQMGHIRIEGEDDMQGLGGHGRDSCLKEGRASDLTWPPCLK